MTNHPETMLRVYLRWEEMMKIKNYERWNKEQDKMDAQENLKRLAMERREEMQKEQEKNYQLQNEFCDACNSYHAQREYGEHCVSARKRSSFTESIETPEDAVGGLVNPRGKSDHQEIHDRAIVAAKIAQLLAPISSVHYRAITNDALALLGEE